MNKKIGIIGTGNMGQAIIGGITASEIFNNNLLTVFDVNRERIEKILSEGMTLRVSEDCKKLTQDSDIIILAVKPDIYPAVLDEIKNSADSSKIIVIIAAGMKISTVESFFSFPVKVVRTMPNTPLLVNEGMTALCGGTNALPEDVSLVEGIFSSLGKTEIIDEKYFDVYTALAGSSPAYIYMIIEAMADGGVLRGFSRAAAYRVISQAVKGSAEMLLKTGKHPGELKDMVCSPGGTTIEAVSVLEKRGVRSAFIEAVSACSEKSRILSKK